jgi:hypothetical protein
VTNVRPGDVVACRSQRGFVAAMIRLGAALLDRPNTVNHVIVAHHRDAEGTLWGIEGRPGGVGWRDLGPVLRQPYTVSNAEQPKTEEQRATVCTTMEALLGTEYDWFAIAGDGLEALHVHNLWGQKWAQGVPGHVVCSSGADFAYARAQLAAPRPDRDCTPGDWAAFIMSRGWLS